MPSAPFSVDREDVLVSAVKSSDRGEGLIVRLTSYAPGECKVFLRHRECPILSAILCDARERDHFSIPVSNGAARVPLTTATTTVRLVIYTGPPFFGGDLRGPSVPF